jgi:choline monooxygenase
MLQYFVDKNIAIASTLDSEFYIDPLVFEETKERIFALSLQFIGDTSLIDEAGKCYPFTLLENYLNEPLILTKDQHQTIHCLSNVCTHRGNILINQPCKTNTLRCKYHGRLFSLNGNFISMPGFKEVQNFPSPSDNLKRLPLFQWEELLFTSLKIDLDPVLYLKDMMERLHWLPLNEFIFRPELSKNYFVNAHWALYCENYLEGFHIPFVHSGLNTVIDYGEYTTELFRYSNLQLGIAKGEEDCFDLPPSSIDYGKKIAAYYFWVFPNTMFNFYPWGLSVNIVQPIATDKTKVSFFNYMWKQEKYNRGAGGDLDKVEMEDEEIVQSVQKGIRSRFYQHGRYSVTREQGTHHFHRLISEFMQ